MTKKHFIALADTIREHNRFSVPAERVTFTRQQIFDGPVPFTDAHLDVLASFCHAQNYRFDRERWLDYIAGRCGPGGGKIKQEATNQ